MEIGAHLPVYGTAATREGVTLVARRIEALGYDSLWVCATYERFAAEGRALL